MAELVAAHRSARLALGTIVAAAVALRLEGLAGFPFEQDELYTVVEARELFATTLRPGIEARPLYYLLQHALLAVGPASPVWLRLSPLIFGLLGVWVTWLLGRRAFGAAGGLLAAFFVAISPWHLYASGMARYWSLVYLLAATFYLWLWTAYSSDRARDHLIALSAALLASATHPSFLLSAAGVAIGVSLVGPDGRLRWRWPSRTAWTHLWGPWAAVLLVWYLALALTGEGHALRNFGGRGLTATLRLVPAMVQWMTPTVFVAGALGAVLLITDRSRPEERRLGTMAATGGVVVMVLLVGASLVTDVYADYGIAFLPLLFVSAAGLVAAAARHLSAERIAFQLGAAAVLAAGIAPYAASHLLDGTRFDYRPAIRRIDAAAPQLPVLAWPVALARHYGPRLTVHELVLEPRALDAALAAAPDLWLIVSVREYGPVGDIGGRGAAWVAARCRLSLAHERLRFDSRRYRVELYRCRRDE